MENFDKIYKEITDEYKDKYLPPKNSTRPKLIMYIFLGWLILNTIQIIVARILTKESNVYSILKWLSLLLILAFIIIVASGMNSNVEYWKKAFNFKENVGRKFWKKVNPNITYNPNREDINKELVKSQLEYIYKDSKIVDIEDMLLYNDLSMYTIRLDDVNEKRITGTFVILDNCKKEISNLEDILNSLNLSSSILEIKKNENKVYLFIDAKEVFFFNNLNFLSENELKEDYNRFNELLKLRENL